MAMFNTPVDSDPSPEEITPSVRQEIAHSCYNPDIVKFTGVGNCYHAIGHVIASLVDNDSSKATKLCESIFEYNGRGAIFYCATGAYMQQDLTAIQTRSPSLAVSCTDSPYPAACYRFELYHRFKLPDQYQPAIQFCLSLEGAQRSGCFNGLGADAYSMVYREPSALNMLCGAGTDIDKRLCVEGVFALLNVYYPNAGSKVCGAFTAGDREMCENASRLKNFSMYYDFAPYMPQ